MMIMMTNIKMSAIMSMFTQNNFINRLYIFQKNVPGTKKNVTTHVPSQSAHVQSWWDCRCD